MKSASKIGWTRRQRTHFPSAPVEAGLPTRGLRWSGDLSGRPRQSAVVCGLEDLETMATILQQVVLEDRPEVLDDQDARSELEGAVERAKAREEARGRPFSRREVNAGFGD